MDQTVVGLFNTSAEAQNVVADLTAAGIPKNQITVTNNDSMTATSGNNTNQGGQSGQGEFWNWLLGTGVPESQARYYQEGVRRQGTLVTVMTSDDMAQQAAEIMSRHNAMNVEQQGEEWKKSGWTGYEDNNQRAATGSAATAATAGAGNDKTVLPVIEEQLQVGKREVEGGGVRVYTRVSERPVEEQVTLRQEHVTVDRRPVDRAVTDVDRDAFQEKSIEMVEHSEEAVVSKQARVVEEVVVGKEVTQHTDTVRDTVRRTDVEVEQTQGNKRATGTSQGSQASQVTSTGFDRYANDFRAHYDTTYGQTGKSYGQYGLAYRYGYDLADDNPNIPSWNSISDQARGAWEETNPGTWDQFKDAVQYGWDKAHTA